jgi:hypothetical protein
MPLPCDSQIKFEIFIILLFLILAIHLIFSMRILQEDSFQLQNKVVIPNCIEYVYIK